MTAVAVIPARAGSKRVPGKNVRHFLGKPLIRWTIEFARNSGLFDRVVLTTDGADIAAHGQDLGITVMERAPHLASDTARTADVVIDVLNREQEAGHDHRLVALLQPTSPVRFASRWQAAFAELSAPQREAMIGVSPVSTHPYQTFRCDADGRLIPWEGMGALTLRSQDLPPAAYVNGALYLLPASTLREGHGFFPEGSYGVLCDAPVEAIDLDTEADWIQAEALARYALGIL